MPDTTMTPTESGGDNDEHARKCDDNDAYETNGNNGDGSKKESNDTPPTDDGNEPARRAVVDGGKDEGGDDGDAVIEDADGDIVANHNDEMNIPKTTTTTTSNDDEGAATAVPQQTVETTTTPGDVGRTTPSPDPASPVPASDPPMELTTIERDVAAFVMRPPVREEEALAVGRGVREHVDAAAKILDTEGAAVLLKSGAVTYVAGGGAEGDGTAAAGEDGSAERDEEEAEAERVRRALEESVVRGNPRRYQVALLERAKVRNTIVHLGTGQGKTLVALLLIKHLAQPAYDEGKQTLFLVPSIALAVQHTNTLRANLPYEVATACHTSSNSEKARRQLRDANIIVATHGAASDMLRHYGDLFRLDRVNLLVLDECHYATGNHGYARTMEMFYHALPPEKRPRVLGLTASPLVNVRPQIDEARLREMLGQLEAKLDAEVACLSEHEEEDLENADGDGDDAPRFSGAEEKVVKYENPVPTVRLPEHERIGLHNSRIKELNQLTQLYDDFGPLVTGEYCRCLTREVARNRYERETARQYERMMEHLKFLVAFCDRNSANGEGRSDKLLVLERLLRDLLKNDETKSGEDEDKDEDKESIGVIFVERRITALALHQYFRKRWKDLTDDDHGTDNDQNDDGANASRSVLKCDMIVRQSTQVFKYLHPSHKLTLEAQRDTAIANEWLHQTKRVRDVLEGLRSKATNVLIATSVVEEGVDVDACSFVVVLDHIKTSKGYVQMKGRARRRNAKFFVFENAHPDAPSPPITLEQAQEVERRVRRFIIKRERERREQAAAGGERSGANGVGNGSTGHAVIANNNNNSNDSLVPILSDAFTYKGHSAAAEIRALIDGEYRASQGCVEVRSAKSLLNRYSLSIPLDMASRSSRQAMLLHMPIFDGNRLTMPAHLPSDVRVVELPPEFRVAVPANPVLEDRQAPLHVRHRDVAARHKKEVQNRLALMACVRLHSLNLLNDRLLPLRRKDMHDRLLSVALKELPDVRESAPHAPPPSAEDGRPTAVAHVHPIVPSGPRFELHNAALKGGARRRLAVVAPTPLSEVPPLQFNHHELDRVECVIGARTEVTLSSEQWDELADFYTVVMDARWRRRTGRQRFRYDKKKSVEGVVPPYVVAALDEDGALDWTRMRTVVREHGRTDEERRAAVLAASPETFDVPRLWVPVYDPNVVYIAVASTNLTSNAAFPHQEEYKTYTDYIENKRGFPLDDKNSPLFAVQRIWQLPRKMQRDSWAMTAGQIIMNKKRKANELDKDETLDGDVLEEGEINPLKGLSAALLPQHACMEAVLPDAALYLHCVLLPQVMYHVERCLATRSFIQHCKARLPVLGSYVERVNIVDLLESLTARSCSMNISYDRLEYLGDAVLKLLHTDALLRSTDLRKWVAYLHEGDLSTLRSAMGSNERLKDAAQSVGMDKFILTVPLGRGQWVPVGLEMYVDETLESPDGEETERKTINNFKPSNKVCADVIEAILGLVYTEFGYVPATRVAEEMMISLPTEDGDPDRHDPRLTMLSAQDLIKLSKRFLDKDHFDRPDLVMEALTHPSCIHEEVPCYQKLEWVGDAVLCLAAREWVYKKYPSLFVAELVVIETTLVCNETLAFLGYSKGLHKIIHHRDPSLPRRFEEFERNMGKQGRGLWGTDPPKVLPDVVEALLGAAHVDGGLKDGQNAALFVLQPILNAVSNELNDEDQSVLKHKAHRMMHPKQVVHELAGRFLQVRSWREEVFATQYSNCPVWRGTQWGLPNRQSNGAIGQVLCCGLNVVAVAEGTSHVAKNRACALAVHFFQRSPELLETVQRISMDLGKEVKGTANDEEGGNDGGRDADEVEGQGSAM